MHPSFTLFLVLAVATALQPPKSFVSNNHLRGGHSDTDVESNLHHDRILLTGLPVNYTLDADFDEGSLVNVNYDVPNQLQLNDEPKPSNFLWLACTERNTVVKVDTITGTVLGEYQATPDNHVGFPSHAAVDQLGNVWAPSNYAPIVEPFDVNDTVVHIGLKELNQCEDRNENGKIDTSTGLGDIKAWSGPDAASAMDECILHNINLNNRYAWHVSFDKDNNVWLGGWRWPRTFDLIKGGNVADTGKIIKSYRGVGFGGINGFVDKQGFLWSVDPLQNVLRWDTGKPLEGPNGDPAGKSIGPLEENTNWAGQDEAGGHSLCIDGLDNVWITELGPSIHKYGPDGTYLDTFDHGFDGARGCVVDGKGDVWVANTYSGRSVGHFKNDGTHVGDVNLPVGSAPMNVAVDGAGKVWSTDYYANTLSRINPALNNGVGAVDLTVNLGYYCWPSFMGDKTGSMNIAPPNTGSWTVIHDGGDTSTDWGHIKWTADVPSDMSLTVQVSSDGSLWKPVISGDKLEGKLETGSKLHVRVLFMRPAGGKSPVLYDLSLFTNNSPNCTMAVASPSNIWPPNHKFRSVVVNGVTDPDGDNVTINVTSIYQDEPVDAQDDGSTCADAKITAHGAEVRAERSGANKVPGDGRVYHINFTAYDSKGGDCKGEVLVCVPPDQDNKKCKDGVRLYNSTECGTSRHKVKKAPF